MVGIKNHLRMIVNNHRKFGMNHIVTIAATGTYDIAAEERHVAAIIVENSGSGDLGYGDIPEFSASAPLPGIATSLCPMGTYEITVDAACGSRLRQGMIAQGHAAFLADTAVISVAQSGGVYTVTLDNTLDIDLPDGDRFSFYEPVIDGTTGIAITSGGVERFSSSWGARFLQQGMRLYSDAGTTVKIFKRFA